MKILQTSKPIILNFCDDSANEDNYLRTAFRTGNEVVSLIHLGEGSNSYRSDYEGFEEFMDQMEQIMITAPTDKPVSFCTWVSKDSKIFPTVSMGDYSESENPAHDIFRHVAGMANGLPIAAFSLTFFGDVTEVWVFVAE